MLSVSLDPATLADHASQRAESLRAQGLGPGQVVLCPDTPALDLAVTNAALALLAAALLPYRTSLDRAELAVLAEITGAEWRWDPSTGRLVATGLRTAIPWALASPLALLIATSGSEGRRKVTMLTQANLLASATAVNQRLLLGPEDAWLCCLRLSHIGGLAIIQRCTLAGARLILHESFDADAVADDLHRHAVTHLSLVPPMLDRLLTRGVSPPPSLRVLLVGGQALSSALAERALVAGWPLYVTYGMTETSSQIATSSRALAQVPMNGHIGPLLPGVEIGAAPGEGVATRLRLRGPMLMAGYANPRRVPGLGLDEGWLWTADRGGLDEDGELRIIGRVDDLLVIGGTNVAVTLVEAELRSAPGVTDLVVVGLSDPVWGHRLVAVYQGEVDEPTLDRWCRQILSGPERPRAFKRLHSLPLLDSGKHDRVRIRELAQTAAVVDRA